MSSNNSMPPAFNQSYLEWKGWSTVSFGHLTPSGKAYLDAELKRTGKDLGKRLSVLEYGFGVGNFLAYARNRGWDTTGVEDNPLLVEAAAAAGFKAIRVNDTANLAGGQFDLIVAIDVLEHVPQDKLLGFLQEVLRLLKKDGVFLARFPNGDSPFGLANQNGDLSHVSFIGSDKARMLARLSGAEIVYLGGEAQPLNAGNPLHTLHRVVTLPLKFMLEWIVGWLFFPRRGVFFCPVNLVLVMSSTQTPVKNP